MWSDHINYYGDMRTHQLVLTWIEKQLSDGELSVAGRLPAERTLAEKLGVSRTSVREAIRILEAMGVVRAGVGSGQAEPAALAACLQEQCRRCNQQDRADSCEEEQLAGDTPPWVLRWL